MSGPGRHARCVRTGTVASIASSSATRRPLATGMDCALATGDACARFRSRAHPAMNAWMAITETTATSRATPRTTAVDMVSATATASACAWMASPGNIAISVPGT
eukprot:347675-Rhodomonas_salina.1